MITITAQATSVNLAEKRAIVRVTRTDDSVIPPDVWSYELSAGVALDTAAKSLDQIVDAAAVEIGNAFIAEKARLAAKATLISTFETKLAAKLLAMEAK
jgi:hypothetical protein